MIGLVLVLLVLLVVYTSLRTGNSHDFVNTVKDEAAGHQASCVQASRLLDCLPDCLSVAAGIREPILGWSGTSLMYLSRASLKSS